jgi:hypothetical protein
VLPELGQDVARTPIKLRQTAPGVFTDATDHPLTVSKPRNPEMTAYQFKHAMQWQFWCTARRADHPRRWARRGPLAIWSNTHK